MVLSGKLSEKLKSEAKALWTEAAEKEFLVSMAKGTLDTELFKNYMVQDYLYLKDYIGILKRIREMAEDEKLAVFLDGIIGDTEYETYKVHVPNLRSLGISEERAAELEASLSPQLTEDEQEYLEMYHEYAEKGEISEKERRRLDKFAAALGISEETDCISLIVSEETGRLSIAVKGELFYNLSLDDVRMMLVDELRPKKEFEIDEEIDEEEIYEENK